MIRIPIAATENGRGVVYTANLEYKQPGQSGLRVDNVEVLTEQQQQSLRNVRAVAESVVGKIPRGIVLSFEKPIYEITGQSWGLMLCLGIISLRSGIPLKQGVTGSAAVESVDKISPIGYLEAKTNASIKAGYKTFLVSPEQDTTGINDIQFIKANSVSAAWFQAVGAMQ